MGGLCRLCRICGTSWNSHPAERPYEGNLYAECHDAPSGRPVGRIFIHENGRFPEKEFGPVPLSDESERGAGRGELF